MLANSRGVSWEKEFGSGQCTLATFHIECPAFVKQPYPENNRCFRRISHQVAIVSVWDLPDWRWMISFEGFWSRSCLHLLPTEETVLYKGYKQPVGWYESIWYMHIWHIVYRELCDRLQYRKYHNPLLYKNPCETASRMEMGWLSRSENPVDSESVGWKLEVSLELGTSRSN